MGIPTTEIPRVFDGDFQTDFLSVDQLAVDDIRRIHEEADAMKSMAETRGVHDILEGSVYDLLFWDSDSTRTKYSFIHAIERLGARAIPFEVASSSRGKGESFERTVEMLDSMLVPERDGLVIRHNLADMVAVAADLADVRVVNAGDGDNEHPTQAVLDSKTVVDHITDIDEAYMVFFGDLARARTVNSTAIMLARLGIKRMAMVAPADEMRPREQLLTGLRDLGVEVTETDDLREVAHKANGIYATRTQYNLMPEDERSGARERLAGLGLITPEVMEGSRAFLMHPLPEDENDPNIHPALRRDPRCIVKEQAANGQWTRGAFLALQAGKSVMAELALVA